MILALAVVVFAAALALDYATVRYQLAVQQRAAHRAARWSVAMFAVGALGTLLMVQVSALLIIPECLGLYVGTVFALRQD